MHAKTRNKKLEKYALSLMGRNANVSNQWHEGIDYFRQSMEIGVNGAENEDGFNYTLWANSFAFVAKIDSAAFYYNKALPLLGKGGNPVFLQFAYISMASFEINWSHFGNARTYLDKALQLAKQSHDSLAIMKSWGK